ncbi:MAG: response regulator [Nitrospirales bacterium]|nr:response regulator [Nitrospirales bacterium]
MPNTILIVDDDTVSRGLIRMVLEYDGYRCLEAEDGATALIMVEDHAIDLMMLDYMMPKVNGIEVLTALQQPSKPLSPPTIMITGMLQPPIREKATQLGVFAILEKPYDLGELRAMVAGICAPGLSVEHTSLSYSVNRRAESSPRA